ncbi:T9SS type A sorting domain-containing protein [Chryseobacterium sp. MMS23-Vi53]|uniref:T9SS type A sorting domain-containing protein n=1 Tax=Chryseobacterium sp. MMS23-Vi53 TaxID=3386644 RepID=UPI0039E9A828
MKKIKFSVKKWAVILAVMFTYFSLSAQTIEKRYFLGTYNQLFEGLNSNKKQLKLKISDTNTFDIIINYEKKEIDKSLYIEGEISEKANSFFHIQIKNNTVKGNIILPYDKKAYVYLSERDSVFVKEADIDKIICTDVQKPPGFLKEKKSSELGKAMNVSNLQSFPGAEGCLLMDFDGHVVPAGTGWNGGNSFYAAPSGVNDADILEAWEIVAEDYRPFSLNVTTDENVFNTYPENKRTRCIITPTDIAAPGFTGFALINSFSVSDLPCWVFTLSSGTYGKIVGEVASHEFGHTFGLSHDGQAQYAYYSGHGDWAPIMGVSYYKPVTQWSKAEYINGTNHEDDLSIISNATNGFGYRNDNAGDTFATAIPLNIINGQIFDSQNQGVIEKTNDIDMFYFTVPNGNISLKVKAIDRHSDLLLKVILYDSNQTEVNRYQAVSPNLGQPIDINMNLKAGKYFLAITAIGEGTPDTGFTTYASLGYYDISGSFGNLDIKENSNQSILQVYPNPAVDELNIKTNSQLDKYQVKIFNSTGQKIYTTNFSGKSLTIPFSDKQKGLYLVIVKSLLTNEEKTFKIIKK